jgi:hypothetical protein
MTYSGEEKRLNQRFLPVGRIFVLCKIGEKRQVGKVVNVSIGGCLIHLDESLGLKKNDRVELVFGVPLNGSSSNVTKLHWKTATVIHVTKGNVGFVTQNKTSAMNVQVK